MRPKETIALFDSFLAKRGLSLEAVVVGGTALGLLGVVSRQTKDCDVLHPMLSEHIRLAAKDFAAAQRQAGEVLADDWLNNGPTSLANVLPAGWESRVQAAFAGRALTLRCLGREDLLRSKLFALCDRGLDLQDCLALAPTSRELQQIAPWLEQQDGNPDWPTHVRETLEDLERRLSRGV